MIRPAALADKARVITLLEHSRAGAGFDRADGVSGFYFPFDPAYAERLFLSHLAVPHRLCIVLDVDALAQGVLMALAVDHPFGPVRLARETMWWIEPDHRGPSAMRMLAAYEQWAVAEGCRFVGMGGMGDDPEVGRLYRRRGYRAAETHFLRAL
jgi:Acetyltransferase (GNAT) family